MRTLLLWLVLASLLPGVIVAAVLFVHQYQHGHAQLLKDMLHTVRAQSLMVDKEMVRIQGKLEILALSPAIQSGDLPAFYRHAQDIMKTETVAGAIVLIDATGQQVMNTLRPLGKELPKTVHPELLQRTFGTGHPSVSDLYFGGVTKSFFVAMEVPVWQGGNVVYGLDMGIPAEHLSQILIAQKLPQDWVTALLDSHGVVIARSQHAARFVGQKGGTDLIEQMDKRNEGTLTSHILEGAPAIVAFSRSASSGWTMAIGVPSQSLEAALLRTVALFGLGTAILFGLGVGVAWYMSGRIARSVKALTAPAMALEAGEAVVVSRVHFREANEVARAMARTAQLLDQRTRALRESFETLQESEERYRTLIEWSLESVAVHRDGKLLYVNPASIRMFGAGSAHDLVGKPILDFVHPDFHPFLLEFLKINTEQAGVLPMIKMTLLKLDGSPIIAEAQSTLIIYNGKPAFQTSMRDITERDKAEEALRRSRIELRKLVYHQDSIREDERRRIALDIHDSLGQNLMVLRIDMSLISEHIDSVGVTKAEIDAIVEQIDTTIKSVRAIINDLRPAVLSLGLHAAVEWQAKEFERHTGIPCELHIDHDEFNMDERVATALFRIVQEALTNIMRHAQATHVQIDMLKQDGQLVIQIEDDGIGLPATHARRANAFGLIGIEERLTVIGGTFAIDSTPGHGTTLILSVPLDVITTQQLTEQHRL